MKSILSRKSFENGLLIALTIIISFPELLPYFGPGIDSPLMWVFNHAFATDLSIAKDINFPHGPLAFLLYPLPIGNNLMITGLCYILLQFIVGFNLLKLHELGGATTRVAVFAILVVLFHLFHFQYLAILCIASCFYLYLLTEKNGYAILGIVLSAFALFIKSYMGIISFLFFASFIALVFFAQKKYKQGFSLALIYPFSLLIISLLLFGTLSALPNYLYGIKELASDNSTAVSYYPDNNWFQLAAAFIFAIAPLILLRIKKSNLLYLLFLLPAFAAWKHGMAREDFTHLRGLLNFAMIFFSLLFLAIPKQQKIIGVCAVAFFCFFFFNYKNAVNYRPLEVTLFRANAFKEFFFDHKAYKALNNQISQSELKASKLSDDFITKMAKETTDIYPWDYSYIPANNLVWRARPILHNYASYSSWLDGRNASHFRSNKAPKQILWQAGAGRIYSYDDYRNDMEGIDYRYLLNDEPKSLIALLENYQYVLHDQDHLLIQKRLESKITETSMISKEESTWNEWIAVPKHKGILRAKVKMNHSIRGKMKSFLYKDEASFIYYKLENGDILRYRMVPKNAEDGLWINPFILQPCNDYFESPVVAILFKNTNIKMMTDEIQISWEQVLGVDPMLDFFGKKNSGKPKVLIDELNQIEKSNTAFWKFGAEAISEEEFYSMPHSNLVKAQDYSTTFNYTLDSIPSQKAVSITMGFWIKAAIETPAKMVLDINSKEGTDVYWTANPIKDFIHIENDWQYAIMKKEVTFTDTLPKQFSAYIWNDGNTPLFVDDFSVRIESLD